MEAAFFSCPEVKELGWALVEAKTPALVQRYPVYRKISLALAFTGLLTSSASHEGMKLTLLVLYT